MAWCLMALPEPMSTNHQWGSETFAWGQFRTKYSRYLSLMWVWKLLIQNYLLNLTGPLSNTRNARKYWRIMAAVLTHWPLRDVAGNLKSKIFKINSKINVVSISSEILPTRSHWVNPLRPRQIGRHFADDTFKCIFLKENVRISIKISLKFVPKSPIDDIPALFQILAWRRPGDKPLSEAMMESLLTHICVARPQWVKWHHLDYEKVFNFFDNQGNFETETHKCCACWWTRTVGLTLWGWVTHICISKIIIIDSDNGLSLGRHQTIIWTNAGILLIGPLATNSGEISIRIQTFSFKKMHGKCLCEM